MPQAFGVIDETHIAWKMSRYGVFSGPYFPAFGLNAGALFPQWHIPIHRSTENSKEYFKYK